MRIFLRLFAVMSMLCLFSSTVDLVCQESCSQTSPGKYSQTNCFFYTFIGGFEQVDLSSLPSQTEPFARFFVESGTTAFRGASDTHREGLGGSLWASIRMLGAPDQSDTKGIFSVFADPTGQITTEKLSSVGTSMDFMLGPALQLHNWANTYNQIQFIVGFGATTPLQSNEVTEAFIVPQFGTIECNTLFKKFGSLLPSFGVSKSPDGVATGSNNACLLNTSSVTNITSGNTTSTTYAPVSTLAFSNADRTSFFLKDFTGLRFNRGVQDGADEDLGSVDFGFGMDSSISGGVFRANRWVFKTDAIYPVITKNRAVVYVFGAFSTRLERNVTNNSPLILQAASLASVNASGAAGLPNVNTVVLPLQQPDRDFYRIGVGIDILSLFSGK